MSFLKDAIKYLFESGIQPGDRVVEVVDNDNKDRMFFVDDSGAAREVQPTNNRAKYELELNTLTGLVNYIKSDLERKSNKFFLHVINEGKVALHGLLESDGGRELLAVVNAIVPRFSYEYFHDAEELIIALQSNFVQTEDRDLLLKVIGNVKEENVRNTGDNGFSQAVTIKTGVASADDVIVPNPVELAPYRTFLEVNQPASDFIFRMKDGPRGAIFEADGGVWRNEAIANVRDYLATALKTEIENGRITIIA
ncbi:hypothetical protein [Oceanobacillus sp. FSL H7-0719]|uniref:hypothetical protein n=1 Tax=Oceanobacillus sp. FSL H7-0719 TaxID=2954507 RepID=UPI003253C540